MSGRTPLDVKGVDGQFKSEQTSEVGKESAALHRLNPQFGEDALIDIENKSNNLQTHYYVSKHPSQNIDLKSAGKDDLSQFQFSNNIDFKKRERPDSITGNSIKSGIPNITPKKGFI